MAISQTVGFVIGAPYIRALVHTFDDINVSYGFMVFGNDTSRGFTGGLSCHVD